MNCCEIMMIRNHIMDNRIIRIPQLLFCVQYEKNIKKKQVETQYAIEKGAGDKPTTALDVFGSGPDCQATERFAAGIRAGLSLYRQAYTHASEAVVGRKAVTTC